MLYLKKLNPTVDADRHQKDLLREYDVPDSPARNDREHGIPLGRGHGEPLDLAEIGILNGKGIHGLRRWFIESALFLNPYGWRVKLMPSANLHFNCKYAPCRIEAFLLLYL